MTRQLMKGNEAVVKAAILAGCRSFYGYPITPATEITEAAAYYFPKIGGTFLQAESEIAAINMVYGAAAAGERTMTASSGPGLSLMQEGLSYLAGSELPAVIVDVTRGGPGLGNIAPEQSDYNQVVRGGGHGSYHSIVLAPHSVQEMCDLTLQAFELADRYRNPVVVMTDAFVGQMMEPVAFPDRLVAPAPRSWAVRGDAATRRNVITSIHLTPEELERHLVHLEEKYAAVSRSAVMCSWYRTGGAEIVLVGHGIVARVLEAAVDRAREMGIPAGLLRPVTLWPFPARELAEEAEFARSFLVVELSNGQMVQDVRLAVGGRRPVRFYSRCGGMVPTTEELLAQIVQAHEADHVRQDAPEAAHALWGV